MKAVHSIVLSLLSLSTSAQIFYSRNSLNESVNSSGWVQTNGPGGGFISDIQFDPFNSSVLYAIGPSEGIYRSINSGNSWEYHKFPNPGHAGDLEISPSGSGVLFTNHLNLSKSTDGGVTWTECNHPFGESMASQVFKVDPLDPEIIYVAGVRFDGNGIEIYKSENLGDAWLEITNDLAVPAGSSVSSMGLLGNGKLFLGINDHQLTTWHKGKVFYTGNDGTNWIEVNFGQTDDRFIYSIHINSNDLKEVWISQGPLYNTPLTPPYIFYSRDSGNIWHPVNREGCGDATQTRVIGNSIDGNTIYIAFGGNLCYTDDFGNTFTSINLPPEIMRFDIYNIAPHPVDPDILFLPTGSGGVAYSENNGAAWIQKNEGILNTSINLLAADPVNPGRIYCASWVGEGVFRTDNYGQNWKSLNNGGIVHPFDDELIVDPFDPSNVWFISDVPFIQHSEDFGDTWKIKNSPYGGGTINFGSIYCMGQSADDKIMYALNNGYGIYKGQRTWSDESYHWTFLNLSEIDYSYSLAVEDNNSDIIYSGYSRKPFETNAKISASYDGGENWFTSLIVDGAEAITSVVIDPLDANDLYAASVGESGGQLWKSENKGQDWQTLNDYFNFTTIHSFAVPSDNSSLAYAGVWGGGTFKTTDYGNKWEKLSSEETFSAAAIAVNPDHPNTVYLADRTLPILYRSTDGGESWSEYFDAGSEYRRLMWVTVDPGHVDRVYVSAMKMGGPGKLGGLFRIESGNATDISGTLAKVALTLTIDDGDPSVVYVVLHESGIYKSTSFGNNWMEISGPGSGLPESGFNNLLIDPNDSAKLYLIGGCDVRFETFESAGLDPDEVNGVYRSEDGGSTWSNINNNVLGGKSGPVKSLVFYNNSSDFIYLGTESGVYYSTNGGDAWIKEDLLPYNTLGGIAISGNTIYAFTNGAGLFKGTINGDHSITWDPDQKIIAEVYFTQLLKDKTSSSVIYASGYPGGIFKSTDGGDTWHEKNFGMVSFKVEDPLRQGYYALAQSNSDPDVFYLGLYEKGVYRSSNAGETWYPVNGQMFEMADKQINSIAVDNADENIVYIGTEEGVFKTSDGGQKWVAFNAGLTSKDIKVLHVNHQNQLFAGTRGYGLYQSVNNQWQSHMGFGQWGVIWPMWNDRPLYQYTSLLIHPLDNSRMIMGTFPQGIYKSNDGGNTWKESNIGWTNDGVFYLICHPDNPEVVFAGTYNGINRSLDFGEHWEMWDNGMPPEQWVFSIDFHPSNPDIMYACSKNGENEGTGREDFMGTVMKSIDGGMNWQEITNGLAESPQGLSQEFYKIIVDQFDPNTLYLASQRDGIYISTNGGDSWVLWNDGLTNPVPGSNGNNVTNTLVLSGDNSMLYYGTAGSGVWRRMIAPILPVNNLSAFIDNHKVYLSWHFADFNNSFTKFNVYREEEFIDSIGNLSPIQVITTLADTQFIDDNIDEGVQYYYVVTAEDGTGYENPYFYTLGPIVDAPLQIFTQILDSGWVGVHYADTIIILGGQFPYTSKIYDGVLPAGLVLDETSGIINGIPQEAGSYPISVVTHDGQSPPLRDSGYYTIVINENVSSSIQSYRKLSESVKVYPNPFTSTVRIEYQLSIKENVQIEIFNSNGELVRVLENSKKLPGTHFSDWNGRDKMGTKLGDGIYHVLIRISDMSFSRKLLLLNQE
jgi:photosystem II stability/assembly factor-like uncharacterized protein